MHDARACLTLDVLHSERRGYHFVLAAEDPQSDVVYGCGINGEVISHRPTRSEPATDRNVFLQLTVGRMAGDALTLLNNTVASTLLQSRAMLWYNSQLVVSNRDFLFYDVESDGGVLRDDARQGVVICGRGGRRPSGDEREVCRPRRKGGRGLGRWHEECCLLD